MRNAALAVYRKAVRMATGSGLDSVPWIHSLHNFILHELHPPHINILGETLYLDPHDSLNLSIHGIVEPELSNRIASFVPPGSTAIDIGAHIGYFTLALAHATGPKGRVFAFEAHPDNAALLRKSAEGWSQNNVTIENQAVSSTNTPIKLYPATDSSVDHRIIPMEEREGAIEIPSVILDEYFPPGTQIAFIKMDIQGAEGYAVEGMRRLINDQQQLIIATEFEPWGLDTSGYGTQKFADSLADLGFTLYDFEADPSLTKPTTPEELSNAYPVVKDRFTTVLAVKGELPNKAEA